MSERSEPHSKSDESVREHAVSLLSGHGAHLPFEQAVADVPEHLRGVVPDGAACSLWQQLEHLRIAQWDILGSSAVIPDDLAAAMPFHPRVVRVVLFRGTFHLHGVDGDVRPPAAAELPDLTLLSYGTSITHGSAATAFHLTYVAQAAWRLGDDLINLGVGGACLCEPAFGEYIGARPDWDVATLALSVNMIARGFTIEEFTQRTTYLVQQVVARNPAVDLRIPAPQRREHQVLQQVAGVDQNPRCHRSDQGVIDAVHLLRIGVPARRRCVENAHGEQEIGVFEPLQVLRHRRLRHLVAERLEIAREAVDGVG